MALEAWNVSTGSAFAMNYLVLVLINVARGNISAFGPWVLFRCTRTYYLITTLSKSPQPFPGRSEEKTASFCMP